jgi:hypothetical protein
MRTLAILWLLILLIAVPCMAQSNLQFQWDSYGMASQATGYKLYQSITSGTYGSTPVATFVGGNLTSGTIPNPVLIGKYYFVLTAYASGNESPYSNEVTYTVGLTAPTGLKNPVLVAIGKVLTKLAGLFGWHPNLRITPA